MNRAYVVFSLWVTVFVIHMTVFWLDCDPWTNWRFRNEDPVTFEMFHIHIIVCHELPHDTDFWCLAINLLFFHYAIITIMYGEFWVNLVTLKRFCLDPKLWNHSFEKVDKTCDSLPYQSFCFRAKIECVIVQCCKFPFILLPVIANKPKSYLLSVCVSDGKHRPSLLCPKYCVFLSNAHRRKFDITTD